MVFMHNSACRPIRKTSGSRGGRERRADFLDAHERFREPRGSHPETACWQSGRLARQSAPIELRCLALDPVTECLDVRAAAPAPWINQVVGAA